ncbi:MAG: hypothetical protein QG670_82 [Thermoproteota archaeon]|nr:hypothetical protein [Thermoproteota archaeon]
MIVGLCGKMDNWSGKKPILWTSCILAAGVITMSLGFGAWRSQVLDWNGFVDAFRQFGTNIFSEIIRMMNNPIAFVGLVVMIVGFSLTIDTVKNLLAS